MPIGIEVEMQPNNTSDSRSSAIGMTPPEEDTELQEPTVAVLNHKRGREATPAWRKNGKAYKALSPLPSIQEDLICQEVLFSDNLLQTPESPRLHQAATNGSATNFSYC
jgi:hypothetical protein